MQILIYLVVVVSLLGQVDCNCDRTFMQSELDGEETSLEHGKFEAPNRVSNRLFSMTRVGNVTMVSKVNDTTQLEPRPMHCVYKFIAREGQKVTLNFSSFNLRGDEPECLHEYVDIFVKFKSEENLEAKIGSEIPNGRFCTSVRPRRILSLYNTIVLIIYTDLKPPSNRRPLFSGSYEFIKSNYQDQMGQPEEDSLCTYSIYSSAKKEGEFQSVSYPGVYVKGLKCSYKFIGEPKQRVRLEFLDLDLYSGGSHCPFDSIKIFDGLNESEPLINTFCGSHRSLIIYSTKENLLVTFTTLERKAEIQNRGFTAYFEFSDTLVDTSFIQGPNVRHIRGSECDQRIISYKGTSGVISSPDSRHHPNAICRYIFEGLQTSLDYEKVLMKFLEFDLKTQRLPITTPTTTTTTTTTTTQAPNNVLFPAVLLSSDSTTSGNSSNSSAEQCADNYVRIYTGEQKTDQKQDPNDYDYVFCSNEILQSFESDAASLLMEYNSGSIGGSFRAEYSFIVDFRIPGFQTSTGCDYLYKSDYLKSGTFNSPRHPSWYINDINCTYTFMTKNDEALLLQFVTFKMFNTFEEKVLGIEEACRGEDQVEIYEISVDQLEQQQRTLSEHRIGTYCATTTPGPILSHRPIRVKFTTNNQKVHYGFSALYSFNPISALKSNEFVTHCGGQIVASKRLKSGYISSPDTYRPETYEKRNHICSWNITARSNHRIALRFERFELEGSRIVRGCITASIRLNLNPGNVPTELCGTLTNSSEMQFVSEQEWLSITFISTKQASGSSGFSATWSEVKRPI